MKNVLYPGVLILFLVMYFTVTSPVNVFSADDLTFTDTDAKSLKSDDPDTVADVLYKLSDIYEKKGKEGLKAAVPHLIESAEKELSIPADERWNIVDIVKVLSMSGDERTKPILLRIMSVMWGGGNPFVARGFLAIGPSVVPDVVDSLKSASSDTRGRAALTLHKMSQFDESGEFFSDADRNNVRKYLADNLDDENVNLRIYTVIAMRSFGDESVISALEHTEKYDAHKDSGGTYEVRIEATETLNILRGN